jgi:uncharacterized SAM-binding protein YcdF (DUF218 family)
MGLRSRYRLAMAVTWRRVRIRWVVVPVCLLLIAAVIGGLPVYVRPQVDPLRHADAILVLGGDGFSRYPFGVDLGMQSWAPKVVLSNPGIHKEWLTKACNTPHSGIELDCFVPNPPTTLGEGRELRRLAERYGWRSVIVVTFTPHISRARFILQRCFDGELTMVASPTHISLLDWPVEYVYQTAGYVWAAQQPGC